MLSHYSFLQLNFPDSTRQLTSAIMVPIIWRIPVSFIIVIVDGENSPKTSLGSNLLFTRVI